MAEAICQRWKLSNAERDRVVALVAQHMFFYTPDWTDGTVRRFVRKVGAELVPALFAIREGDIAGRGFGEDPEVELGELRRRIAAVAAEDAALAWVIWRSTAGTSCASWGSGPGARLARCWSACWSACSTIRAERPRQAGSLIPEVRNS